MRASFALIGLAVVVAFASGTAADVPATTSAAPRLILHHGNVLTMDDRRPSAQALAIANGRIVAVGSNTQILRLKGARTRLVHLRGRTVLPGFNDSHAHWLGDAGLLGLPSTDAIISAALAGGWTSISELFVNDERLTRLRELDATGQLRLRVNAYLPVNFYDDKFGFWFEKYTPKQQVSPRVRIAGIKGFVDGLAGDILLGSPHSDRPDYNGRQSWTQQELTEVVRTLQGRGWQLAIHTGGDGAADLVLNAIEAAAAGAPTAVHRHRMEHLMVLRDDQLSRMRRLGVIASFQLTHFTSDWINPASPVHRYYGTLDASLGPARIGWAGRWRDLLAVGVISIGSTDTPWAIGFGTHSSALEAVEMAVTRVGRTGATPTPWMLAQRITVRQALELLTVDAAFGTFEESQKGSLTRGKLADLVVLSQNPLAVAPDRVSEIGVLVTLVGGVTAHCVAASRLCP